MNFTLLFSILGAVAGGALYIWLAFWAAISFGAWVGNKTGSYSLNFGAYFVTAIVAVALPFAIGASLGR